MRKKRRLGGKCPICELEYHKKRYRTRHHIYPKVWFKDGITAEVCRVCHNDFNREYPMNYKWSHSNCLVYWVRFCITKGKNAYQLYPHLRKGGKLC